MKSKPYKLNGKLFRYDFDHSMVEYIYKADAEDIALEEECQEKTGWNTAKKESAAVM